MPDRMTQYRAITRIGGNRFGGLKHAGVIGEKRPSSKRKDADANLRLIQRSARHGITMGILTLI